MFDSSPLPDVAGILDASWCAPSEVPDARLEEDFCELTRVAEAIEARRLRLLAQIDRRRPFERDGYLSTASWLFGRFRIKWSEAKDLVRTAKALDAMPVARESLESGHVSASGIRLLASAYDAHPETFARDERVLVDAAKLHGIQELGRVVAYWRQAADAEVASPGTDRRYESRSLHVSPMLGGMVRVDGDLDPETGETLITALRAVQDAATRSGEHSRADRTDMSTPAQRRADALGELCRQWLDRHDRPRVAGERPHVTVTVDLGSLRRLTGAASELEHVGPVPAAVARRLACDASIARVVMNGPSEPLDVGRRTPVVPSALRRAIVVRDRTCRFPGCDRPHAWCDTHHVRHWVDGGPTALSNLLLLCRAHHRLAHDRFKLEIVEGRTVFRRRDGSLLEDRAPPSAAA